MRTNNAESSDEMGVVSPKAGAQTCAEVNKYNCGICNKYFGGLSNIKTHMLTHTGEKPYSCENYTKQFAYIHSLTRHRLFHAAEKKHIPARNVRKSSEMSAILKGI